MQGHVEMAPGLSEYQGLREAGQLRSIKRVGCPVVPMGGYGWLV